METIGSMSANLLIGIGLAAEYFVILQAIIATREENRLSEERVAEAGKAAAQANERASKADLELARLKAPRILWLEQQSSIIETILPFAGTIFDVGTIQGDLEVFRFEQQLEYVLERAGWKQIDWIGGALVMKQSGSPTLGMVTASDVTVGAYPEKATTLGVAAARLADALNAVGILAHTEPVGEAFINKNRDAVHIVIGRKT